MSLLTLFALGQTLTATAAVITITAGAPDVVPEAILTPGSDAILTESSERLISEESLSVLIQEDSGFSPQITVTAPQGTLINMSAGIDSPVYWSGLTIRTYRVRRWGPVGQDPILRTLRPDTALITLTAGNALGYESGTVTAPLEPDAAEIEVTAPDAAINAAIGRPPFWSGLTVHTYRVRRWGSMPGSGSPLAEPDRLARVASVSAEFPTPDAAFVALARVEFPDSQSLSPRPLTWYHPCSTDDGLKRWGPIGGRFDTGLTARIASASFETPDARNIALVSEWSMILPGAPAVGRVSQAWIEIPDSGEVTACTIWITAPEAAIQAAFALSAAPLVTVTAPDAFLLGGQTELALTASPVVTVTAPTATLGIDSQVWIASASASFPEYDHAARVSRAWLEVPGTLAARMGRVWLTLPNAVHVGDYIFGHRTDTDLSTKLTDEDTDG